MSYPNHRDRASDDHLEHAASAVLSALGLDATSVQLRATPARMAATWRELTAGCAQDPGLSLRRGDPVPPGMQIVELRNIEFRSLCAHHFLPFSGQATVLYAPGDRLLGIGSIVRALETLATRPQLQETLGCQLVDCIIVAGAALGASPPRPRSDASGAACGQTAAPPIRLRSAAGAGRGSDD